MAATVEPPIVQDARRRAADAGFPQSSASNVGALLAVLAAATPDRARILELGTGTGVGLAWIVHGLQDRTDASVLTVDTDPHLLAITQQAAWPDYVQFLLQDGAQVVQEEGPFDLIFADAIGGKIDRLDATIAALATRGILVVDDMDPTLHQDDGLLEPLESVARQLLSHPALTSATLPFSTHVILAVRTETAGDVSPRNSGVQQCT
jgi:demethylmenaquinone methyltransferase/2-methoxy-6-polyprenyl-1,4-benzoquinol methylase